jgi:hypothetical protein
VNSEEIIFIACGNSTSGKTLGRLLGTLSSGKYIYNNGLHWNDATLSHILIASKIINKDEHLALSYNTVDFIVYLLKINMIASSITYQKYFPPFYDPSLTSP